MEFESKELKNAELVSPNSTHMIINKSDANDLKDDIKLSLILKDKKLLKWYEMYYLKEHKSTSGLDTLIHLIRILKDQFVSEHKDDNIKNLTVRKSFDNIILSLELLMINKIDISPDIINTIFLSYLAKNFI